MDILFLCDLHIDRPWVRDRVPGLKSAISDLNIDIQIADIYDFCGAEGKKIREHKNRNFSLLNLNINIFYYHSKDFSIYLFFFKYLKISKIKTWTNNNNNWIKIDRMITF